MKGKMIFKKTVGIAFLLMMSIPLMASEKNYDIRISPALLLIGITDAEVNIRVNDNITISPMITYFGSSSLADIADTGDEMSLSIFGVRGYWHPGGVFKDGIYISPFYKNWNMSLTTSNVFGNRASGSMVSHQIGATVGYLWQWDNLNTNIGIGYSVLNFGDVSVEDSQGNKETVSSAGESLGGVAADLSVGFAF